MPREVTGRARQSRNARILGASTICHVCGHDGADAVDHVIALANGGRDDETNLAPAHHFAPCPTCGIKCNRVKTDKPHAPIIRRSGSLH